MDRIAMRGGRIRRGGLLARAATVTTVATILGAISAGAPGAVAGPVADPVVVAAGDIACDPGDSEFNGGFGTATECRQRRVSDLALRVAPERVLALGDEQYDDGRLWKFRRSYDPSWGRLKDITSPVPGNHEYDSNFAPGYFDYFNGRFVDSGPAGNRGEGWYGFDVGTWRVVALNSNCDEVGCSATSPQAQWLQADLLTNPADCVLAYWHHPRFSSGQHGNETDVKPFWDALYAAGADVVLSGHDHDYERFAPKRPDGSLDDFYGIRQFVVGTGGKGLRPFKRIRSHSMSGSARDFGLLKVTLQQGSFKWRFVPANPRTSFSDNGTRACHGAPPPPAP